MDNYGYYTLSDASTIAAILNNGDNVMFNYSLDDGLTAFVITIIPTFKVLNQVAHGNPRGRVIVGILLKGCFHFDPNNEYHPNYVGEKLGLRENEAISISNLLNAIFPLLVT